VYGEKLIFDFRNVGSSSPLRGFPGLPVRSGTTHITVDARQAYRVMLKAGDLLSFTFGACALLAFDERGKDALHALGLKATDTLQLGDFDSAVLLGWINAQGGKDTTLRAAKLDVVDELIALKAQQDLTLWVICPVRADHLISGRAHVSVHFAIKHATDVSKVVMPEPLGDIRDEFTVKRGSARAYDVAEGEILQIIDLEGQQCSDFTAFDAEALAKGKERMIDSTATRSLVRQSYPGPGLFDKFYDCDMRPMLQVIQDTCGQHDTFGLACTARAYEERGFPGHLNCSDNISNALDAFGVQRRTAWPAINFFWRTWIDPSSNHLMTEESHSRPGDYVAMRAIEPLVCVSTACPDDIDPINGWNPTDVHVRIYRPDTPIRRAVAYREKEDAPMSLSQESAFHARTQSLTQHYAPARDLWVPTSYASSGMIGEYWACREAVTVQDMSGLRKFDVVGPDAEHLLQLAMTRDIAKLAVWRGTYALMCDDTGGVIDDGTLFRLGPEQFRWCCGTEESGRVLEELARKEGLHVRIHGLGNRLPNLALQGPKSRDLLRKILFTQPQVPNLDQLKWFGVTVGRLYNREGAPFMLSRSGYTGELGYEIFCAEKDAVAIWDAFFDAGAEFGLTPMGNDALETIRIEAGLAAANAEFAAGVDAFEAGLGFAVDLKKSAFTGKDALERNGRDPRRVLKGLMFAGDDVPHHGAAVFYGERQVGEITSATRSPTHEHAIALARIAVEYAQVGKQLEVGMMDGRMKRLTATVSDVPFVDPTRSRARA